MMLAISLEANGRTLNCLGSRLWCFMNKAELFMPRRLENGAYFGLYHDATSLVQPQYQMPQIPKWSIYFGTLVPKTILAMVFRTKILKRAVCGPFGMYLKIILAIVYAFVLLGCC